MNRRKLLSGIGLSISASIAGCIGIIGATGGVGGRRFNVDQSDFIPFGTSISLTELTRGLEYPTALTSQRNHDRLYVSDREGLIQVLENGDLRDEPFLDISDRVLTTGEQGLFDLALHPAYNDNRFAYLRYSAPQRKGTPSDYSHTFVLAEFRATEDYRRLIPSSERPILEIPQPDARHNSGSLAFGPDGYLYIGVGDGGLGKWDKGKGHAEDWYDWNRGGNGQDVEENLLGSILRIDIDQQEANHAYGIPTSNPLVGKSGKDEHYAWGFRNPWGISFHDGDLFTGDVGQADFEEINLVAKGGNYGWNVREGLMCINGKFPLAPLPWCPRETPSGDPLRDPIVEYPHEVRTIHGSQRVGSAVVGGYVYDNAEIPSLKGKYVFGDLGWTPHLGRIFAATPPEDPKAEWRVEELRVENNESGRIREIIPAFGKNTSGDLYVLSSGSDGGKVSKIRPA